MNTNAKRVIFSILKYIAVGLVLFSSLWLFVYIFSSSFKPFSEIMSKPRFFPQNPILENYKLLLFSKAPTRNFPLFISNSLVLSLSSAFMTCIIACLAAYGFTRYNYPGKSIIQKALLFTYIFPTVILLVPLYNFFALLNMLDNYISLVIIYTALTSPFCTWILISFFEAVPKQMEEAAYVDGANKFQTFIRIVVPVSAPGIITAATYAFITSWGEYMFASILIRSNSKKTITLGIVEFTSEQGIEWGRLLASSVIVIMPVVLMFLPVSTYFIKGFTAGAIKE